MQRSVVYPQPNGRILTQYLEQKSAFVEIDAHDEQWKDYALYAFDMLDTSGSIVRHDSKKLTALIQKITLQNQER